MHQTCISNILCGWTNSIKNEQLKYLLVDICEWVHFVKGNMLEKANVIFAVQGTNATVAEQTKSTKHD